MASLFAHTAIPWVTRRLLPEEDVTRRLTVAAIVCSIWPDVDLVTLAWEVRPGEPLGHRGLTHSLLVAAAVSFAVSWLFFRGNRWILAFLFAVSASHGLLDAATPGETGVALLAPLTNHRFAFPFKIVPACPMGVDEYLGPMGLLTFANELLFIVLPLAIVVTLIVDPDRRRRTALVGIACCALAITLRTTWPLYFAPRMPRRITTATGVDGIAHDDLPGQRLVTRLDELRALGLFDRTLEPSIPAWSSSFFPAWFGGEAGRWMDGTPTLFWRTVVGYIPPTAQQARAASGDALFRYSPTEKVDIALGHLDFPATHDALLSSHNAHPKPRYWYGRCNGVAAAAVNVPEPFRAVDVTSVDGTHVRFHPQDIKALLSVAYYSPARFTIIGDECSTVAFDAGATCSMNPALLVIALLNRLGVAKQSLAVDALPTPVNQYYALASARVRLLGAERPVANAAIDPAFAAEVAGLVDVAIDLALSSTTLAYGRADVREASDASGTTYEHVGVVPVPFAYTATVALSPEGELIGGVWTGDPPDGPDNVVVVSPTPKLTGEGTLPQGPHIPWAFVQRLARVSADPSVPAMIDLSAEHEP
jgi:inner membrane protein